MFISFKRSIFSFIFCSAFAFMSSCSYRKFNSLSQVESSSSVQLVEQLSLAKPRLNSQSDGTYFIIQLINNSQTVDELAELERSLLINKYRQSIVLIKLKYRYS